MKSSEVQRQSCGNGMAMAWGTRGLDWYGGERMENGRSSTGEKQIALGWRRREVTFRCRSANRSLQKCRSVTASYSFPQL